MGDNRHYVPRFMTHPEAGRVPMWIAIKNTVMEAKAERCLVELEKWDSDDKDAKQLTLYEVRYSQLKAAWFTRQPKAMMNGPDVYEIRRGEEVVATVWQPLTGDFKLEITFVSPKVAPILFADLTVESILKLLNAALAGQWKRPANASFQLQMVIN